MPNPMGAIITSYISMSNRNKREKSVNNPLYYDEKFRKNLTGEQLKILDEIEFVLGTKEIPLSEKVCPECGKFFSVINAGSLELDCCRFCKSYWFDMSELAAITGTKQDIPSRNLASRSSKYSCPVCSEDMTEYLYLKPNNLLVDACSDHGVYLESGELKRAFDAVNRDQV